MAAPDANSRRWGRLGDCICVTLQTCLAILELADLLDSLLAVSRETHNGLRGELGKIDVRVPQAAMRPTAKVKRVHERSCDKCIAGVIRGDADSGIPARTRAPIGLAPFQRPSAGILRQKEVVYARCCQ